MRGVRREHELVVRAALGAGVGRLRRLLLAENLAAARFWAPLLGVLIARRRRRAAHVVRRRAIRPAPSEIRLDGVVLGFTLALAVVVALLLSFVASLPKEGTLCRLDLGRRAPDERRPAESSGCSADWSSRRSRCRWCCWRAPDCSPAP